MIRTLEVNTAYIIPLDGDDEETMTVSTIDANHCPGSLMLLFEGYFGSVLYTGDFRYSPSMFVDTPLSTAKDIDVLYLDNTYCSPKCDFPSRDEAKKRIIKLIEEHPDDNVLIGIRQLGKEDLLADLALHFETHVVVNTDKYEQLELLEAPNVFTKDFDAGFIYAVPHYQVTEKNLLEWNAERPTIGIVPSALFTGIARDQSSANKTFVHVVSYSDHSSYKELHEFVSKIQPKSVLPVVKTQKAIFGVDVSQRANMSCFDRYLDPFPLKELRIPESVQRYMAAHGSVPNASLKSLPRTISSSSEGRKPLYKIKRSSSTTSKGIVFNSTPVKNSPALKQKDFPPKKVVDLTEPDSSLQCPDISFTPTKKKKNTKDAENVVQEETTDQVESTKGTIPTDTDTETCGDISDVEMLSDSEPSFVFDLETAEVSQSCDSDAVSNGGQRSTKTNQPSTSKAREQDHVSSCDSVKPKLATELFPQCVTVSPGRTNNKPTSNKSTKRKRQSAMLNFLSGNKKNVMQPANSDNQAQKNSPSTSDTDRIESWLNANKTLDLPTRLEESSRIQGQGHVSRLQVSSKVALQGQGSRSRTCLKVTKNDIYSQVKQTESRPTLEEILQPLIRSEAERLRNQNSGILVPLKKRFLIKKKNTSQKPNRYRLNRAS